MAQRLPVARFTRQPASPVLVDRAANLCTHAWYPLGNSFYPAHGGLLLSRTAGSSPIVPRASGLALLGDGATYFTFPTLTLAPPFSISIIASATSGSNASMPFGDATNTNNFIWLDDGGGTQGRWRINGNDNLFPNTNVGTPAVYTFTLSNLTANIYKNGVLIYSAFDWSSTATFTSIGAGYSSPSFYLNGGIVAGAQVHAAKALNANEAAQIARNFWSGLKLQKYGFWAGVSGAAAVTNMTLSASVVGVPGKAFSIGATRAASVVGVPGKAFSIGAIRAAAIAETATHGLSVGATRAATITGVASRLLGVATSKAASIGSSVAQQFAIATTPAAAAISTIATNIRSQARVFAASITTSGAVSYLNVRGKVLSAAVTVTSSVQRGIAATRMAVLSAVPTAVKTINKAMSAATSLIAAITAIFTSMLVTNLTLSAVIGSAAAVGRQIEITRSATLTLLYGMSRLVNKVVSVAISMAISMARTANFARVATIGVVISVAKGLQSLLSTALTVVPSVARSTGLHKTVSVTVVSSKNLLASVSHQATSAVLGASQLAVGKLFIASFSLAASLNRGIPKVLQAATGIAGYLGRGLQKGLSATTSVSALGIKKAVATTLDTNTFVTGFLQKAVNRTVATTQTILSTTGLGRKMTLVATPLVVSVIALKSIGKIFGAFLSAVAGSRTGIFQKVFLNAAVRIKGTVSFVPDILRVFNVLRKNIYKGYKRVRMIASKKVPPA